MSSRTLRHAVKKREYKERAQPTARQRLGLLEKKKDYKERAKDYHSKEDRIKKLREKAALRNQDEFYFGMVNSQTKDGIHQVKRGKKRTFDEISQIKEQDMVYYTSVGSSEAKASCLFYDFVCDSFVLLGLLVPRIVLACPLVS